MGADRISKNSTMQEILEALPGAQRALFSRYHVGGCSSCGFQPTETLEQVCRSHNIWDVQNVIAYLQQSHERDQKVQIHPEGPDPPRGAGPGVEYRPDPSRLEDRYRGHAWGE